MALKRGNKVRAEFSMSSLTDIIFLLLIFFVLTSKFVSENGFKLQLPEGTNQTMEQKTINLMIDEDQQYFIGPPESPREQYELVNRNELQAKLENALSSYEDYKATVVLKAHQDIPVKDITYVMTIGSKIKQRVILATESPQ